MLDWFKLNSVHQLNASIYNRKTQIFSHNGKRLKMNTKHQAPGKDLRLPIASFKCTHFDSRLSEISVAVEKNTLPNKECEIT